MKVDIHPSDDMGRVVTLLEDIVICGVHIPAGFKSDGCSVPRCFWGTVFPPTDPSALQAGVIHDYLYTVCPQGWTRASADLVFYRLLLGAGVPKVKAWLAYQGVRLFGGSHWCDSEEDD